MGHRERSGETWEDPHVYPPTQGEQGVMTAESPLDGALWTEPVCEDS